MERLHKFETLDGMRGVACIAVALHHLSAIAGGKVFVFGYLAVDLFFVLSGVVIAHSYDGRLASGMSVPDFMLRRFIRLWPMIFLGCVTGLFAAALGLDDNGRHDFSEYASAFTFNMLFLPSPIVGQARMFPLNPPEWSLFYELLANFGFAMLFSLGLPVWRQRLPLACAILLCAAVLIFSAFSSGSIGSGFTWPSIAVGIARVGFSFSLGVMIRRSLPRWHARFPRIDAALLLALVGLLFAINTRIAPRAGYDLAFVLILSPLIVMAGIRSGAPSRFADLFDWLGKISFPLYAIHVPMFWLGTGVSEHLGVARWHIVGPLAVLLPFLSAWLADAYDTPARAAMTRLLIRKRVRSPG